jgi:hypothetical protein
MISQSRETHSQHTHMMSAVGWHPSQHQQFCGCGVLTYIRELRHVVFECVTRDSAEACISTMGPPCRCQLANEKPKSSMPWQAIGRSRSSTSGFACNAFCTCSWAFAARMCVLNSASAIHLHCSSGLRGSQGTIAYSSQTCSGTFETADLVGIDTFFHSYFGMRVRQLEHHCVTEGDL